jgi:SM-20-related protein
MSPALNWPDFCQKLTEAQLKEIMSQIEETGIYASDAFIDKHHIQEWVLIIDKWAEENKTRTAEIGRTGFQTSNTEIRSDKIIWIDEFTGPTLLIGEWLNSLMSELKNHFRLPLQTIESHFSIFPAGAKYGKHIDNGPGQANRLFTFILYLNPDWQTGDGGELIIYDPKDPKNMIRKIEPRGGTFVLFRSELFPHEVLTANKPRYTFTGWMRRHARV